MMASLRAAVEAYPGHAEANTDLLLTLATQERWSDVLAGALRFSRVSQGDASGLLLAGLALHRMNRSAEAAEHFDEALSRMSDADADELIDVGFLLDRDELRWYRRVSPDERRSWEVQFWKTKDRAPSTEVNERWVEHMARATYARFRFGTVFGDAGEVWVRFGGPNSIHIVDEGSGRQTEFWNYGSGPDITFVRWTSSKRTDLTPEGRAYVDDLGKIFPPQ
jgi:GWxTD domain-containing protein